MKACPFCGGSPSVLPLRKDPNERKTITYKCKCNACGVETLDYISREEAWKKWDSRADLADTGALTGWIDLNSGVIVQTESDSKKPLIHGFNILLKEGTRESYRVCNWVTTKTYFRKKP